MITCAKDSIHTYLHTRIEILKCVRNIITYYEMTENGKKNKNKKNTQKHSRRPDTQTGRGSMHAV